MSVNIWGISPQGEKTIFFLRCPLEDAPMEVIRAKKQGWTNIVIGTVTASITQEEETPTDESPNNRDNR